MIPRVRLDSISKKYGSTTVLTRVSLDLLPGEVHVLAGGNGAGKSTLIKILGGLITDYEGSIAIDGAPVRFKSPNDARRQGVSVIHQELSLVRSMTVLDNLFLGDPPSRYGFLSRKQMRREGTEALARLKLNVPLDTLAENLPISVQQLLEIAKALRHDAKLVVMDEPTSALNAQESERLFELIAQLKAQGRTVVYISHRMEEVERLADRITVLRDGQLVATDDVDAMPFDRLIELMVGREAMAEISDTTRVVAAEHELALEAEKITVEHARLRVVDSVSFQVRKGEVLGIAGLEGSGNSALLNAVFGSLGGAAHGKCRVFGRSIRVRSPRDAVRAGMALVGNDRKETGLVLGSSIVDNACLADLPRLCPYGWQNRRRISADAAVRCRQLAVRAADLNSPVGHLSGGNQQKVVLAKWLQTEPKILLLDEPTRGIDIHAKREIYRLIEQWKANGMAIVLVASELPELLHLSDRIMVMRAGRVVKEFQPREATAEAVMQAALQP